MDNVPGGGSLRGRARIWHQLQEAAIFCKPGSVSGPSQLPEPKVTAFLNTVTPLSPGYAGSVPLSSLNLGVHLAANTSRTFPGEGQRKRPLDLARAVATAGILAERRYLASMLQAPPPA